jgi:hypothetical protein
MEKRIPGIIPGPSGLNPQFTYNNQDLLRHIIQGKSKVTCLTQVTTIKNQVLEFLFRGHSNLHKPGIMIEEINANARK